MSWLFGSNKNPKPKPFVPALEANRQRVEEAFDEMTDRLESYQAYLGTDAGKAASRLADMQISYLYNLLTLPSLEFCRVAKIPAGDSRLMGEVRAELRGELRVWKLLKTEPDRLVRLLNKRKEKGADSGGRVAEWETPPEKS